MTLAGLALALTAADARAQGPSMPSTLRYGSGLIDVPVSSVLPHMSVTGTFSGFFLSLDRTVAVDDEGREFPWDGEIDRFFGDGSLAIGLFDRGEMGVTIQSLGDEAEGGNVWGLFGRVRLIEPVDQGLGLAVGARYLTSPSFDDGVDRDPGRLGFPDARLRERFAGGEDVMGTNLSLYGVATAHLRGFDAGILPRNDMTLSLGYGGGMFEHGPGTGFYGSGSNGWFAGASTHFELGPYSTLALMAEHNGFDVNVGAQVDVGGLRAGVLYLGANHGRPAGGYDSEYRSPKLGVLASLAVCPRERGFRCRPRMMERTVPDTVWIPPPPPDTVVIAQAPDVRPEGEAVTLCLSTGQNVSVHVTAAADTLVGQDATPIDRLRPVVDFAGAYATGAGWFARGDPVNFEGDVFERSGEPFPIDCGEILRVGVYQGVPVFADRAALRPFTVLFIPARLGLWQRYQRNR